ncbi:hypothetical protein LTR62_008307 [Meristemomyces frigidus]|uniref:Vacuolar membrane protein n=1 Tax=Meristemomyces frigidus TaxID=1508187 RepID=A0AAN7TAT2_9PEZI|nr:hypothetical protein LTR62_008307 [Meristemomyces frigidus]
MGCCGGDREKGPPEHTQKWDFITLSDFKATSVWTTLAYIWVWFMAIVAVAVYGVDTFTAVNLLVFDKWSSQIDPAVPFKYSKWIFAACILLSWVLCFYEWFRAIRVMRRGGVAESYMDTLAVTLQSMRGSGWKRFLVFTELTKSKKGADYIAFFVYFAFDGAVRVILAEGPRQAVNAMSLYAVLNADVLHAAVEGQHSNIERFFINLRELAVKNEKQAVILCSMLFTLVIWVFSALALIAATVFYLVFLWHYIPQRDGRLSVYCRCKIDRRLEKIVDHKVKAALEDEERKRQKVDQKAELKRQKTGDSATTLQTMGSKPTLARQPTLPQLGATPEMDKDDKLPQFALARQDTTSTMSTLPRYESRPPTRNGSQAQPTLPTLAEDRPQMPSRTITQNSTWSQQSYESDAPLLNNAGHAGFDGRNNPAPTMPPPAFSRQGSDASYGRPMPNRTMTQGSQMSQRPFTPTSSNGSVTRPTPGQRFPVRSNTGFSFSNEPRSAISPPPPQDAYGRPVEPLTRQNTQDTFRTANMNRQDSQASSINRQMERRPTYGSLGGQNGSFSRPMARNPSQASTVYSRPFSPPVEEQQPLPYMDSYEMTSQPSHGTPYTATAGPTTGGYVAFNPGKSRDVTPRATPSQATTLPQRNVTVAGGPGTAGNYFGKVHAPPQRSATAPVEPRYTTDYADILDTYDLGESGHDSPTVAGFPFREQPQHRPHPPSSIYSPANSEFQAPSIPSAPVPSLIRAQTASPIGFHSNTSHGGVTSSIYSADDRPRVESQTVPHLMPRAYTTEPEYAGLPPSAPFGRVAEMRREQGRTDSWEKGPSNRF